MFGLKPDIGGSGVFSRFAPKNATMVAKGSNGLLLNYYQPNDYVESTQLGVASYIIGYLIFSFFFLFCYGDLK